MTILAVAALVVIAVCWTWALARPKRLRRRFELAQMELKDLRAMSREEIRAFIERDDRP